MKKIILFSILITNSLLGFCQDAGNTVGNSINYHPNFAINNSQFAFNPSYGIQPSGLHSVQNRHGNPFSSPGSMFDVLTNKFGINMPTRFRYTRKGVNFQAGLLTNSRQPKIGAGISLPRGFNFTAGYGMSTNGFNKFGYSPSGRNQGIQITAGYRLFGKR